MVLVKVDTIDDTLLHFYEKSTKCHLFSLRRHQILRLFDKSTADYLLKLNPSVYYHMTLLKEIQ